MKVEEVSKLGSIDRFLYWIRERHQIYLRRQAGEPKPWTDDEILQRHFFTNPYRENDKTTVWFRENIREPLRDKPDVLLATIIFRWFNLISTGEKLVKHGLILNWNGKRAQRLLENCGKVFTGAFMIVTPKGVPKIEGTCQRIQAVWKNRKRLIRSAEHNAWTSNTSMRYLHEQLMQYDGLGGFMAYEIVTDLRHTYLLENSKDVSEWCNPGPGCIRGIYRVTGNSVENKNGDRLPRPEGWLSTMKGILKTIRRRFGRSMPKFEMREVEHSLCEWDKYERVRLGGRAKRSYQGV